MGQSCMLQSICSDMVEGHAAPPLEAGVTTERVRLCLPPPHVLVQVVHSAQYETLQSTTPVPVQAENS